MARAKGVVSQGLQHFLSTTAKERWRQVQGMSAYCTIALKVWHRETPKGRKVSLKSSVLSLSALSGGLRGYYFGIGTESHWDQGLIREPLRWPIAMFLSGLLWWIESRHRTDRNTGAPSLLIREAIIG